MTDHSERQEAELDALRAMYPEEGAVVLDTPAVDCHQASAGAPTQEAHTSSSGTVKLPGLLLHRRPVALHFQLPRSYPDEPPQVHVNCEAGRGNCSLRVQGRIAEGKVIWQAFYNPISGCQGSRMYNADVRKHGKLGKIHWPSGKCASGISAIYIGSLSIFADCATFFVSLFATFD